MRVLITTDGVGGVWQYSQALARGLVAGGGNQVALVCIGTPREVAPEGDPNRGVEHFSLPAPLEWMPGGLDGVPTARTALLRLAMDWGAEVIHSNQYCFGALAGRIPTVVVAHSDVLSWIQWHRGAAELDAALAGDPALHRYRSMVSSSLEAASTVVAPSAFMAEALSRIYHRGATVIHNGLWPEDYSVGPKLKYAILAGRLWDESKGAAAAVAACRAAKVELRLAGPLVGPAGQEFTVPASPGVTYLGDLPWESTRGAFAGASYYLATSSYEPFGLATLEAAFSGCAILANDIPSFRDLWDGAAIFYQRNDAEDLARRLRQLADEQKQSSPLAEKARALALSRYDAPSMCRHYQVLYRAAIERRVSDPGNPPAYNSSSAEPRQFPRVAG